MSKTKVVLLNCLLLFFSNIFSQNITNGTLDLSNWDNSKIIYIQGPVDYQWVETGHQGTLSFPGIWVLHGDDFLKNNPRGVVKFRFDILLPDSTNIYSLKINYIIGTNYENICN